jgi:hypothetical protein
MHSTHSQWPMWPKRGVLTRLLLPWSWICIEHSPARSYDGTRRPPLHWRDAMESYHITLEAVPFLDTSDCPDYRTSRTLIYLDDSRQGETFFGGRPRE